MQPLPPPTRNGVVRVLLCGYGHLGLALLNGLLACGDACQIVGVFRWSSRPGRNQIWESVETDFQRRIVQAGLLDIRCKGMNTYDFTDLLQSLKPDVVLVGSWGEILRKHLLNEPSCPLIINCHPSKLPAHRGANPYSSVIRAQETETGVTFHRMVPKIDAGAIILQRSIGLGESEDGGTVRDKCSAAAQDMVPELIDLLNQHFWEQSPLPQNPQDAETQSYFPQLRAEDGLLHWDKDPQTLHRQMRSLFPWIACYSLLGGRRPVLFYDPKFVYGHSQGQAPGTILSFNRGVVQIAVASEEFILEVSSYQFARLLTGQINDYWPKWASPLLAPFLLKPRQRFISPPLQPA
jgi:methionyl-tRNA formyltransferase